jgi:hypothetical protein
MSRTTGTLNQDTPFQDGLFPLAPGGDIFATTGATTLTRIAAGEISLRATGSATAYVVIGTASSAIYRTGLQDDAQMFFGSQRAGGAQGLGVANVFTLSTASIVAGSSVNIAVLSSVNFAVNQYVTLDTVASGVQEFTRIVAIPDATHITVQTVVNSHTSPFPITLNLFTTPWQAGGRPPFTGAAQLTPQTTVRPKGIFFKQLAVAYIVNTANATVPTIGLTAITYANGVAPAVTTLIANATNGLSTAFAATPYVIPVPVPLANQGFIITPNTSVVVEFDFTTGTGGTVDVLGFYLTCGFNYN